MTLNWTKDPAGEVAPFITYAKTFLTPSEGAVDEVVIDGHPVPLPSGVANPDYVPDASLTSDLVRQALGTGTRLPLSNAAQKPVFTVIIDDGANPFHSVFRYGSDQTRVIACWQQGHASPGPLDPSLPFGREILRTEIEDQLRAINSGTSEEDALRQSGLIETASTARSVQFLTHGTHGMHTADIAAGRHVSDQDAELYPIILVNVPPRRSIGTSGVHLPSFVIPAIRRALHWIDALWAQQGGTDPADQWEVVFNLSFGQAAGPKDGTERFEKLLSDILNARVSAGFPRPNIVMPVGNDNLLRSHVEAPVSDATDFAVQIPPGDHTPSVIEFWTQALPDPDWPLFAALGPQYTQLDMSVPAGAADAYKATITYDASPIGMAFARRHQTPDGAFRFQYVFILNATETSNSVPEVTSRPGAWTVSLSPTVVGTPVHVSGDVEVDQSIGSGDAIARRAYFIDPVDIRYDDAGRYLDMGDIRQEAADDITTQIQQVGSQNALTNTNDVRIIAGHRKSDGLPAPYSACLENTDADGLTSLLPNYSVPCEDAPCTRGVASSGTLSGGSQYRGGTSFSAALATRALVDRLVSPPPETELAQITRSENALRQHWAHIPAARGVVPMCKIGAGRLNIAPPHRKDRLSSGF